MARIRSVHPGLWTDAAFVSVSAHARLLFIGLWNEADDGGGFEWKPIEFKMRLLAVDHVDVAVLLEELAGANLVAKYSVDGRDYGAVRNFGMWQRPKKPNRTRPMPDEFRTYAATATIGSEPEADKPQVSSPPTEAEAAQVPPKEEKPPQMEEIRDKMEEITSLRSERPARAKARTLIKPDWLPDEAGLRYAADRGALVGREVPAFVNHHTAKGSLMADWAAAWRTWCDHAVEFGRAPGKAPNGHPALPLESPIWSPPVIVDPSNGKLRVQGFYLEEVFEAVCDRADMTLIFNPKTARPVIGWLADGIESEVILNAIRRCATRSDYVRPDTLGWFDRAVREQRSAA